MSQSTPEEPDYPALPQLSRRVFTHTMVARVTPLWESHRFLCQIDGGVTLLLQLRKKVDVHGSTRDEA